jgi:hypothetical protein
MEEPAGIPQAYPAKVSSHDGIWPKRGGGSRTIARMESRDARGRNSGMLAGVELEDDRGEERDGPQDGDPDAEGQAQPG